jgi:hypothetical protein
VTSPPGPPKRNNSDDDVDDGAVRTVTAKSKKAVSWTYAHPLRSHTHTHTHRERKKTWWSPFIQNGGAAAAAVMPTGDDEAERECVAAAKLHTYDVM